MKSATVVATLLLVLACNDSSGPGNGGGGGGGTDALTVSNATPTSGNGDIDGLVAVVDTEALASGDAQHFMITGHTGATLQQIDIYAMLSDNSVPLVEHKWGSDLLSPDGFTVCSATGGFPACSGSQITATVSQAKVTLTGLVLGPATGDADASTITGTLDY